ncbi:hypothetical protein SAMD00023353_2700080 [Rosellinia necatrix]|uniref:Uncharacterized protein n=1 Tax=Rosellinia necatrix TaxID=77044 RepID=A0A1W2TH16_ROSNE|nr:hypothetical protein SAMD00023353_2700080 [Rosellinia necatrix]
MSVTNANENTIICLGFAAEGDYGDSELQMHQQGLLCIQVDSPPGNTAHVSCHSPALVPSDTELARERNDIVYFDHDTLEKLELYQTGPLRRISHTTTVAIHWWSLRTWESLRENLMIVYSQLRNIERVIIIVDHENPGALDSAGPRTSPLSMYGMSNDTVLEYENERVNWCDIARVVQQTIRDQTFWRECNRRYSLEQILPAEVNPARIPQVCLMRLSRGHDHEGVPRLPPQPLPPAHSPSVSGLASIDGFWNPQQTEEPASTNYSLQDLLD